MALQNSIDIDFVSYGYFNHRKLEKQASEPVLIKTEETKQILNGFKNGLVILSNNWEKNEYVVSVKFKNIDVYKYYYNIIILTEN